MKVTMLPRSALGGMLMLSFLLVLATACRSNVSPIAAPPKRIGTEKPLATPEALLLPLDATATSDPSPTSAPEPDLTLTTIPLETPDNTSAHEHDGDPSTDNVI